MSGHSIRRTFGCFRGWESLDGAPIVDPGLSYGAVFPVEGLQKGLNDRFGRKNIVNFTFRWDGHRLPPRPLIFQSRACLGDELTDSQAALESVTAHAFGDVLAMLGATMLAK